MTWSYSFHRRYSMSRQKNSILINKHALNHEPVPLKHCHAEIADLVVVFFCCCFGVVGEGVGEWNRTFFINQVDEANICNHGGTPIWRNFWAWKFIAFKVIYIHPWKKMGLMLLFVCLFVFFVSTFCFYCFNTFFLQDEFPRLHSGRNKLCASTYAHQW